MAFFGDAAIVECAELGQQRARLGECALRRRIEERQRLRGCAPRREIEHEAGEVGRENFRPGVRLERSGLRLVPQAVGNAWSGTACTPAPLVGGGTRDAYGLESCEPDIRLVPRHPR